jgi:hypothetical protein
MILLKRGAHCVLAAPADRDCRRACAARWLRHRSRAIVAGASLVLVTLFTGCTTLAPVHDRPSTYALQPSTESALGRVALPQAQTETRG